MLKDCDITFTTDTRSVIASSDIIYVMVATPSLPDGSYDISAVQRVADDIGECDFDLVHKFLVIGCTTNPGDCQRMQDRLRDRGIRVLYNPEFIAQGSIIRDLEQADMVLIGAEEATDVGCYRLLYNDIQTVTPNVHAMSLTAAEIVKIAVNCYLTTKISYANMVGEVLIRSGLDRDVEPALSAIGTDTRVGAHYMRYGFGYGGPCLPRDNRAFAHYAASVGSNFALGQIVDQFNQDHTRFLAEQSIRANHQGLPFYMPSITYKPGTDILEESQQLKFCEYLLAMGYRVFIQPSDMLDGNFCRELEMQYQPFLEFKSKQDITEAVWEVEI
jgi:nucleotide sugar dehydrogenase